LLPAARTAIAPLIAAQESRENQPFGVLKGARMGRHTCATVVALAFFCVVCAHAVAAPGTIKFGVADDTGKYAGDSGAEFYARIGASGLGNDRMTVMWDPASPMDIPERPFLDRTIPEAATLGVNLVLSVRPLRANAIGGSVVQAKRFAAYVAKLATTYPTVKTFVIANEPNQPRFWQPQFRNGKPVAGRDYERVLALCYDALKQVDPTITVVGGALSGRGNDDAHALTNRSTSPLRFLYDMGAAYRASKRTAPLMDLFAFHPYPRSSLDSLQKGLEWPMAGYANLDRVKQGLWDAFNGTGQPTTVTGLGIMIDEVGWQVRVASTAPDSPYTGLENVPVTTEARQAAIYAQLVRSSECDSTLKDLFFLPFIDETSLAGFQSGLLRADGTERPSYTSVTNAIASTGGHCVGRRVVWKPVRSVLGAQAFFHGLTVPKVASRQRAWSFAVRTAEDARYVATIVPARQPTRTTYDAPASPPALLRTTGYAKANWTPLVRFPKRYLRPGRYAYRVVLQAAFNPARQKVVISRTFVVR
jgi:hypothetical protein